MFYIVYDTLSKMVTDLIPSRIIMMKYEGFEKSAAMVMDKIFPPERNNQNKTDIILGHSQGAILTAALLSTHDKLWKSSHSRPLGYILNGAAYPNPYRNSLNSLLTRQQQCPDGAFQYKEGTQVLGMHLKGTHGR